MAKSARKPVVKSLYGSLPRRAREDFDEIMAEEDGDLSLHEWLRKRWDRYLNDDDWAPSSRQAIAPRYSEQSPAEIDLAVCLHCFNEGLLDYAIARRFILDDPSELARGLAVLNNCYLFQDGEIPVFQICASGDMKRAVAIVKDRYHWQTAIIPEFELHTEVVYAMLQKNSDALKKLIPLLRRKTKLHPIFIAIHGALVAAYDGRPEEVARHLTLRREIMSKAKETSGNDAAIDLTLHGLYRLLQWYSPEVVSQFDVTQERPWDAGFLAYGNLHPDPLADQDFSDISPVLDELCRHGKFPNWIVSNNPEYELVLTGGNFKSKELLGEISSVVGPTSPKNLKALVADLPRSLCWGEKSGPAVMRDLQQEFEALGGEVEWRVMKPGGFRFFVPDSE